MMKFSDKALRLIGQKLLQGMEASRTTDVGQTPDMAAVDNAPPRTQQDDSRRRAAILPFRGNARDN